LIVERGKRRRRDGYYTGLPLPWRTIRLYDLQTDPSEMHNVAAAPKNAERVHKMLADLAEHMRSTAREPALVPKTDDPLELLDDCVQSHDVGAAPVGDTATFPLGLRRPFLLAGAYAIAVVLASLAGAWLPRLIRMTHTRTQVMMSLCGGLMLGVSLFQMLPRSAGVFGSLNKSGVWTLAGLLATYFLFRAFQFHRHDRQRRTMQGGGFRGLALGVGLYTLINGLSLAASVEADAAWGAWRLGFGTFAAIFLHKPLDAMTVTIAATGQNVAGQLGRLVNGSFAILCPLGVALFFAGLKQFPDHRTGLVGCGLAFSAGVFLCISLSDLLPELKFHAHDRLALSLALLAGVTLAYLIA
jgi:zinc and cadmium transporter